MQFTNSGTAYGDENCKKYTSCFEVNAAIIGSLRTQQSLYDSETICHKQRVSTASLKGVFSPHPLHIETAFKTRKLPFLNSEQQKTKITLSRILELFIAK